MTPMEVRATLNYFRWITRLRDQETQSLIDNGMSRLAEGNPSDVAPVCGGVSELRIDYGPGYRGVLHPTRVAEVASLDFREQNGNRFVTVTASNRASAMIAIAPDVHADSVNKALASASSSERVAAWTPLCPDKDYEPTQGSGVKPLPLILR